MSIEEIVQSWRRSRAISRCITDLRIFERKEGKYSPFPEFLHPALKKALLEAGIERLYSHQAEAIEAAASGQGCGRCDPDGFREDPLLQPSGPAFKTGGAFFQGPLSLSDKGPFPGPDV